MNAELPRIPGGQITISLGVPQGEEGEVDPSSLPIHLLDAHEERAGDTAQFVSPSAAALNVARIRRLREILGRIDDLYEQARERGDFGSEFSVVRLRRQKHVFSAGLAIEGDDPSQTGRGMWLRVRSFLGQMAEWFNLRPLEFRALSICAELFPFFTGSWERDYVEGIVETAVRMRILYYLVPDLFYSGMNATRYAAIGERIHAAGYFLTPCDVLYLEYTTEFEWACRSAGRLALCLQNLNGDTLLHIAHQYFNTWGLNCHFFNPDDFTQELPPALSSLSYIIADTRDGIPLYESGDYFDFLFSRADVHFQYPQDARMDLVAVLGIPNSQGLTPLDYIENVLVRRDDDEVSFLFPACAVLAYDMLSLMEFVSMDSPHGKLNPPVHVPFEGVDTAVLRREGADTILHLLLSKTSERRDRPRLQVMLDQIAPSMAKVRSLYEDHSLDELMENGRITRGRFGDELLHWGEYDRMEGRPIEIFGCKQLRVVHWEKIPDSPGCVWDRDFFYWADYSPQFLLRVLFTYGEICENADAMEIAVPTDGSPGPVEGIVRELVLTARLVYNGGPDGGGVPFTHPGFIMPLPDMRIILDRVTVNCAIYLLNYAQETKYAEKDLQNLERQRRVAGFLMQAFDDPRNTLLLCAADAARRYPELREKLARALFDFATTVNEPELSDAVAYISRCVAGEIPEFVYAEPPSCRFCRPTNVTPLTLIDRALTIITRGSSREFQRIHELSDDNPIKTEFHSAHSIITRDWFPIEKTPVQEDTSTHLIPFDLV
jgi:hypothetical protein